MKGEIRKDRNKRQYNAAKKNFLSDETINKHNRDWFTEFFEKEERLLKRRNGQAELDEGNYKTLYKYIFYLRNTNNWFENKPHTEWSEKDIKRVYEALEEGKITNTKGERIQDRSTYYNKIFKSLPFRMIGLAETAKLVIEYTPRTTTAVRFITEQDFRKLVDSIPQLDVKTLFWVLWDFGENIEATLKLRKRDFQHSIVDGEPEYRVWWRKEILKRSRQERGEINNYPETCALLKEHLDKIEDYDRVFPFTVWQTRARLNTALKHTGIKSTPMNDKVKLKDLRSGMACDMLLKECSREEINKRLGHVASSREIDKYVNFLAIDSNKPKKRIEQFKVKRLESELEDYKESAKKNKRELKELRDAFRMLKEDVARKVIAQESS